LGEYPAGGCHCFVGALVIGADELCPAAAGVTVFISTLLSLFRTAEPDDTAASFLGAYPATGSHFFPGALVNETCSEAAGVNLFISTLLSLVRTGEPDEDAEDEGAEGLLKGS
jgi:hypothetical protein